MATEPTIEEVAAAKARLEVVVENYRLARQDWGDEDWFRRDEVDCDPADLRTLLASHASLEERVKEAKRLAQRILASPGTAYEITAAFVNEKET